MRQPDFWTREDARSRAIRAALAPLGTLYGATVSVRAHLTVPQTVGAKVVCVGGITAGGSGKTPVAIAVARALTARRHAVVFLSRGYGGRSRGPLLVDPGRHSARDVGDEPLLLARIAPTVVAANRREGATLACAQGAQVIVMDDGHQNFQIRKDLSLVVLDGGNPFGNSRILPAGPLREPVRKGLARADAIIVVGPGSPSLSTSAPVLRARICPSPISDLRGRRLFAFAGVAAPDRFFRSLCDLGGQLVGTRLFDDHHSYTSAELESLATAARDADAALFTTEKDFVRLPPEQRKRIEALPVRAVLDDDFDRLLDRIA